MKTAEEKKAYMLEWRRVNSERLKEYRRTYRLQHKDRENETRRALRLSNPKYAERDRQSSRQFRLDNRIYSKDYSRKYYHQKAKNDPVFMIKSALRARMRKALKHNLKTGSAVRELGCSVEELKDYLANLFQEGMSWENWGEWHIDHVKPLASFDLTDKKQFLQAVHYTNLQPMWALDNILKGAKCV